jgi:hypothetical protein
MNLMWLFFSQWITRIASRWRKSIFTGTELVVKNATAKTVWIDVIEVINKENTFYESGQFERCVHVGTNFLAIQIY